MVPNSTLASIATIWNVGLNRVSVCTAHRETYVVSKKNSECFRDFRYFFHDQNLSTKRGKALFCSEKSHFLTPFKKTDHFEEVTLPKQKQEGSNGTFSRLMLLVAV